MLITFQTRAHANITLFGEVARQLLKMMGHSGSVPGALLAAEVPAARQRLSDALQEIEQTTAPPADTEPEDDDNEPPPSIHLRARPLLELLDAAERGGHDVMWNTY